MQSLLEKFTQVELPHGFPKIEQAQECPKIEKDDSSESAGFEDFNQDEMNNIEMSNDSSSEEEK